MERNILREIKLEQIKQQDIVGHNEYRFITADFGFVNSFIKLESELFIPGQPYRIAENRIFFVEKGEIRINVNLIDQTFRVGDLALITPRSIVQFMQASPDFDMKVIGITPTFLSPICQDDFFARFFQPVQSSHLHLSAAEERECSDYFALMWNLLQENSFPKKVIQHLLTSLLYYIEHIIDTQSIRPHNLTRQEEIFQRFIALVNAHSIQERSVGFYADRLCLTPRYLNTVIRQVSQQTVMEWVNQSIVQEAKVLLKHSNLLIYQIADELKFSSPSFFSKFFRKMTGMTPLQYQQLL